MKKKRGMQYAEYRKAEKDRPSQYHLYNQIYEMNYYLFIGQNKKMLKLFKQLEDYHLDNSAFVFIDDGDIVIWLSKTGEYDIFAHELIHAINKTFDIKNIQLDTENDEPQAYLMSWLFRGFYFAVK